MRGEAQPSSAGADAGGTGPGEQGFQGPFRLSRRAGCGAGPVKCRPESSACSEGSAVP